MKKALDPEDLLVDPNIEGLSEEIDVEAIEQEAKESSFALCKNLREIYFDEEFMAKNPKFKERLDVELESLRVLIKMRKSDEIVHDLCLRSIGMNANNGSLYKALSGIQKSMLNIQIQMDTTVRNINNLLKNVQLEFNFESSNQEQAQAQPEIQLDSSTTRGSKKFIEQMREELNQEEITPQQMFEDEEEKDEQD